MARVAEDRKGSDIVILDMRDVTLVADYFVIITGHNTIHVGTLADNIEAACQEAGIPLLNRVGRGGAHWVLLDYGAVVVHVFTEAERHYYNLERLWGDATVVSAQG